MTDELRFQVTFHGPFRVGTGIAGAGVNQTAQRFTLDPTRTVVAPASTLKGMMRAAAADVIADSLMADVFGGRGGQCHWSWSGLTVASRDVTSRVRSRIEINPDTGTVRTDMLANAEELVIAGVGEFTITRAGYLPRLPPERQRQHQAVLRVAAGLVTGVGGTRRRGLGWVTLTPVPARAGHLVRADVAELASAGVLIGAK